jgi:membrane fusion protein (multidrug efflux system)
VIKLTDGPQPDTKVAQRVEVKVGLRRPGRVEITEGLEAGDMIVTAGQQRVQRDGMSVRVIELGKPGGGPARGGGGAGGAGGATGAGGGINPAAVNPTAVAGAGPAIAAPGVSAAGSSGGKGISTMTAAPKANGPNPCAVSLSDNRTARPTRNP